jgi:hypothetical protein
MKDLALKNYLFQNIVNTDGPLQMEALLESNANDLVTSKLLPTDQTQAPALVAFEQALNQIYGNNKKDVTWAKSTLFGMRNSDIFMLINDIEKEALVYLLKE